MSNKNERYSLTVFIEKISYFILGYIKDPQSILPDNFMQDNNTLNEFVPLYADYLEKIYKEKGTIYDEINTTSGIFSSLFDSVVNREGILNIVHFMNNDVHILVGVTDFFIYHHESFPEKNTTITLSDLRYQTIHDA